jgi:hypothetical protein
MCTRAVKTIQFYLNTTAEKSNIFNGGGDEVDEIKTTDKINKIKSAGYRYLYKYCV